MTSPTIRTARPGPGNGWRQHDLLGQPELLADLAHLVLEQVAQRLDQLEVHVLGQPAHVVVALDVGRGRSTPRLDHVGIQRSLHQEAARRASSRATSSNTRMNSSPIDLALLLGVGDAGERGRGTGRPPSRGSAAMWKCRANVSSTCSASPSRISPWSTNTQVSWSPTARCTSSAATAESTPPRQRAEHPSVAHLRPDPRHRLVDDVASASSRAAAAAVVEEAFMSSLAVRGVGDLGVELHAVHPALADPPSRRPGRVGRGASRGSPPAPRVTASPWLIHTCSRAGRSCEQRRRRVDRQRGAAVLPLPRGGDLAAERLRHQLMPVADAQHRHAQREQPGIDAAARPASYTDAGPPQRMMPGRAPRRELVGAGVVRPRSRSTRGSRAPAARSAARTARRSRRPGPGAGCQASRGTVHVAHPDALWLW